MRRPAHADLTHPEDNVQRAAGVRDCVREFPDLTPAWSPDGTQIAFHTDRPDGTYPSQIWVIDADGENSPYPPTDTPPYACNQRALTGPDPSAPADSLEGPNLFAKWGVIAVGQDPSGE